MIVVYQDLDHVFVVYVCYVSSTHTSTDTVYLISFSTPWRVFVQDFRLVSSSEIPFILDKKSTLYQNPDKQQKETNRVDEWINCLQIWKCRATWKRDSETEKKIVQRYSRHTNTSQPREEKNIPNHRGKKIKSHWTHIESYNQNLNACDVCVSIARLLLLWLR